MKKIGFLLMMFFVLVFSGCEGPRGYPGYDGYVNMETRTFTVKSSDWLLMGEPNTLESYYYYDFEVGNWIDDYILKNGMLMGYIKFKDDKIDVYSPLPYIVYNGINSNDNKYFWSEKYTVEYNSGYIRFIVDYNDFMTYNNPPGTTNYKVTIAWGEN